MLIDFKQLFPKYNINPTGVLHVGASEGQEAQTYADLGIQKVVWIEAIPNIYAKLLDNISRFPGNIAINELVGDEDEKDISFHIANNGGQSSSVYEFGTHSTTHPDVKFLYDLKLKMRRLDTLLLTNEIVDYGEGLDFLNMDLQGAELIALKGLGDLLHQFKWAYLEVNWAELYKGCPLVEDIDFYMGAYGFQRVESKMAGNTNWGDALYIK